MTATSLEVAPTKRLAYAGLRVLLVDDQEHARHWVTRVLNQYGVTRITHAEDGRAGLAKATEPGAEFDLILCDLRMPNIDGVQFIRALSALGVQSAVALLSMESERVLETSALLASEHGLRVIGAVPKPLTPASAESLLDAAIAKPERPTYAPASVAPEHLRDILMTGHLEMFYQPKVVLATGRLSGVETLARWSHPEYGAASPEVFVTMCEESEPLGNWLLDKSLRQAMSFAARWNRQHAPIDVAVNVHARAFDHIDLPEQLAAMAANAGIEPAQITLELTERSLARDALRMLDVASRLRLKGFGFAIDDFGTGHSGLTQLQRLPFNQLKIDRQFMDGASTSASKRSVVEASLALAKTLSMSVVAEGIRHRRDWELAQSLGCGEMQGFLVAPAMPEEELLRWAARWGNDGSGAGFSI